MVPRYNCIPHIDTDVHTDGNRIQIVRTTETITEMVRMLGIASDIHTLVLTLTLLQRAGA